MEVKTDEEIDRNRNIWNKYMMPHATYILHYDTRERKHVICGSAAFQERHHNKFNEVKLFCKNYYKVCCKLEIVIL